MIRRPPRSTLSSSSAASDVYKRQDVIKITVVDKEGQEEVEEVEDPWNYWVFELNARGNIDGEQSKKRLDVNFSASAKRVTEKNKFFIRAGYSENKSTFNYEDEDIVSVRQSKDISCLLYTSPSPR